MFKVGDTVKVKNGEAIMIVELTKRISVGDIHGFEGLEYFYYEGKMYDRIISWIPDGLILGYNFTKC